MDSSVCKVAQQKDMQNSNAAPLNSISRRVYHCVHPFDAYLWIVLIEHIVAYHAVMPIGQAQNSLGSAGGSPSVIRQNRDQRVSLVQSLRGRFNASLQAFLPRLLGQHSCERLPLVVELAGFLLEIHLLLVNQRQLLIGVDELIPVCLKHFLEGVVVLAVLTLGVLISELAVD